MFAFNNKHEYTKIASVLIGQRIEVQSPLN